MSEFMGLSYEELIGLIIDLKERDKQKELELKRFSKKKTCNKYCYRCSKKLRNHSFSDISDEILWIRSKL